MAGKPAVYDDISLALFVSGYLIIMEGENQAVKSQVARHLQQLTADTELYGWDKVMWHDKVMWLNQLEQGQATWRDEEAKTRFRQALIWHPATTVTLAVTMSAPLPLKKQTRDYQIYNAPAEPGSKAYQAFNQGNCLDGTAHPKDLHVCSYILFRSNQEAVHSSRVLL